MEAVGKDSDGLGNVTGDFAADSPCNRATDNLHRDGRDKTVSLIVRRKSNCGCAGVENPEAHPIRFGSIRLNGRDLVTELIELRVQRNGVAARYNARF